MVSEGEGTEGRKEGKAEVEVEGKEESNQCLSKGMSTRGKEYSTGKMTERK